MTIGPVAPAATAGGGSVDPALWKSAQEFEAMAIGQMLEPMFATVDTAHGLFGGGAGEDNFKPMMVTEMAKQVEQRGGLGITQNIYDQMLRMQESKK